MTTLEAPAEDVIEIDEICVRKTPSLWLWVACSRVLGQVLGYALGKRSEAELAWAWTDVPPSYQDKPVCTDGLGAYGRFFLSRGQPHEVCDKGSGKTSRVEALNTKWRQRQSGLVRRSCGVSWRTRDDVIERFMLLAEQHNRDSIHAYVHPKITIPRRP